MIHHIINWSIKSRLLVVLALFALGILASIMIPRLQLDAFPDVTNVQVTINTEVAGLGAEEVEQLITFPIESVMYALPDVKEVRSISKTGLSGITVVFEEGTDIYFARQLVSERLQAAQSQIPEGVGTPSLGPNTSGLGQVYQYLLRAKPDAGYDEMALRSLNDWVIKQLLLPIDGVTEVLSFGGQVKQYQVNINPDQLLSYGITQDEVTNALEKNNNNAGGWYMERGQEQLSIRGIGWFKPNQQGLDEIRQVPIKTNGSAIVRVQDVADVRIGGEIRQGAVTMTQRINDTKVKSLGEVVVGIVVKRMGANTEQTINSIKKRLPIIEQTLPEGVYFEPFYDQADLITQAVNTVKNALLLAFVMIVIVLMLFLMNLRASVLVLISIPLSIGMALICMSWLNLSANLMSLGGLAVAIGMLVDGSVVMVENIVKQLEKPTTKDVSTVEVITAACQQVAKPIFFATVIILVVFLPLFSFEGVEAKLFQPLAISIMLAMLAAIAVAFIVIPALSVYFFKHVKTQKKESITQSVSRLDKGYTRLLKTALHYPQFIIVSAIVLFGLSLFTASKLGTEFVPELEEGTINLRVTLAPSSSLNTALEVAPKLENMLMKFPEVTYALSRIGRSEIGGDPEPVNNIEIFIGLKPISKWTSANNRKALQQLMEHKLENFPGLLFNFSQPIATRVDELLSGVKSQLAIKLTGSDLDILAEKGKEIEAVVQSIPGARDVAMEQVTGEAQLIVQPKRLALSRYGLSVDDVMSVVSNGLGGTEAGQIIQGNERYDIYVQINPIHRKSVAAIRQLPIQAHSGAQLRLEDVAQVEVDFGVPQIRRDNVQRRVVVQANVEGRDMGSVVQAIQNNIREQVELPSGYSVDIGGQFESQQRAQKRLMMIVPLALFLIALLLYLAFNSLSQAAIILINIPLAITGGIFALFITGQYLSVPSSVGFITLFGIAVLNGVVLLESINENFRQELPTYEAIMQGSLSRLRPVLMTAITSALGLIPILFSNGMGAEIQKPLATVIVGGLISSTLLTLLILPSVYYFFSNRKQM